MRKNLKFLLALCIIMSIGIGETQALPRKKKKKQKTEQAAKKKSKKSIKSLTKSCIKHEGLFTIYQDTTKNDLYLLIEKDKIGKEFIYFSYAENGLASQNTFRGRYASNDVFSIQKYYNRIEFVKPNLNYYFNPENPLSKASKANMSDAIMYTANIEATDSSKTKFLIKASNLFFKETLTRIKYSRRSRPGQRPSFSLGKLSSAKSKVKSIRNYPKNSDLVIEYVYDNPAPKAYAGPVAADSRSVSVLFQHSFLEMPDDNYKPRVNDPRVGYFLTQADDLTSVSVTPYRDFINRWRLEKKDPDAAISEPVKPITFWIENTTPIEFRKHIKDGILLWNAAFEKAGFKNAVEVKVQPDDAEWDAGDIRYNVVRWTSSPRPPFGGYGPSFINPKTGEILGADVMLEYSFFRRTVRENYLFGQSTSTMDLFEEEESYMMTEAELFAANYNFAYIAQFDDEEMKGMKEQALKYLACHEVGHTLGLSHNMRASHYLSPEELQDKELAERVGLIASIMDYPMINVSPDRNKQGLYYPSTIGPYDYWVIEYGYTADGSEENLEQIAKRSTEKGLALANDAEDMRGLYTGIDPRANIWDMSNDVIRYSSERIGLVKSMFADLAPKYTTKNKTYDELVSAFNTLNSQYRTSVRTITRYIGGVYTDRSFIDQDSKDKPYQPVPAAEQKRALKALNTYVFAPNAIQFSDELLAQLMPQRRGWNMGNDDPKIMRIAGGLQVEALRPLLDSRMLTRMINSEYYGGSYKMSNYITDLTNYIFQADRYKSVNAYRQQLQGIYTKRLIKMCDETKSNNYPYQVRAMALYELDRINKIANERSKDLATNAHRTYLKRLIEDSKKKS